MSAPPMSITSAGFLFVVLVTIRASHRSLRLMAARDEIREKPYRHRRSIKSADLVQV
jgi:hypothetical protein